MNAHFRSQAFAGGPSVHRLAKLLGNYTANHVSRKLGLACDIDEKSCSYEVIYPAQMFDCKPALFMDGHFEKNPAKTFFAGSVSNKFNSARKSFPKIMPPYLGKP